MKKTTFFIIIALLIFISAIPLIYAIFPQSQPAIGDFFGGLQQSATVLFNGFSTQFMQLPYWVAVFGVICLITGIFIDRQAWKLILGLRKRLVGSAIRDTGIYQGAPAPQQPTVVNPQTPTQTQPLPVLPPKEAE